MVQLNDEFITTHTHNELNELVMYSFCIVKKPHVGPDLGSQGRQVLYVNELAGTRHIQHIHLPGDACIGRTVKPVKATTRIRRPPVLKDH